MAQVEDTNIDLEAGGRLTIRSAQPDDLEAVLAFDLEPPDPDDLSSPDVVPEQHRRATRLHKIEWYQREPGFLYLLALADGNVVGELSFFCRMEPLHRHRGSFDMFVLPAWRRRGIGRALLATLLAWARKEPSVEIVGLRVIEADAVAVGLYRSFGFAEEGRLRRGVKLPSGEYCDDLHMSLHLDK